MNINAAYNLLQAMCMTADQFTDGYENSGNWQDIRDGLAIVLRAMERNTGLSGEDIVGNEVFDQHVSGVLVE